MPKGRQRSAGVVVGSVVAITFGTVFVFVNGSGLPAPWPLVHPRDRLARGSVAHRRTRDRRPQGVACDTGAGVRRRRPPLLADRCAGRRCAVRRPCRGQGRPAPHGGGGRGWCSVDVRGTAATTTTAGPVSGGCGCPATCASASAAAGCPTVVDPPARPGRSSHRAPRRSNRRRAADALRCIGRDR
jgi:hypothetical protein